MSDDEYEYCSDDEVESLRSETDDCSKSGLSLAVLNAFFLRIVAKRSYRRNFLVEGDKDDSTYPSARVVAKTFIYRRGSDRCTANSKISR